jgi:hypothetical protein
VSVLLAASLPLLAVAGWVVWRVVRGRPVRRFGLNAIVGVLLLAYFAVTAGLGIFWVANQELPVFDLHYLFGYLTAATTTTWLGSNKDRVVAGRYDAPHPPDHSDPASRTLFFPRDSKRFRPTTGTPRVARWCAANGLAETTTT